MKIKTSDLIGPALDWAVAEIEGRVVDAETKCFALPVWEVDPESGEQSIVNFSPSTDPAQAYPIIFRERINTYFTPLGCDACLDADMLDFSKTFRGPTPLVAAMRAFVASKLGDEVRVPDELC